MSSRTQERREIVNFLYHHFLMQYSVKNTQEFFHKKKKFNPWQKTILKFAFSNWKKIIELISNQLDKKWIFSEISNLEKAILMVAVSEYFSESTPFKVAIVEAVKQVKDFGGLRSHTYVNRILELIFQKQFFSN